MSDSCKSCYWHLQYPANTFKPADDWRQYMLHGYMPSRYSMAEQAPGSNVRITRVGAMLGIKQPGSPDDGSVDECIQFSEAVDMQFIIEHYTARICVCEQYPVASFDKLYEIIEIQAKHFSDAMFTYSEQRGKRSVH